MTLPAAIWEQVRQRANCCCEFCGISEVDAGGLLTLDHFRPRSQDGIDDLQNLIYCCFRCNNYKRDYWPTSPTDPSLWNPRVESAEKHLLLLSDGTLHAISSPGRFTIDRLRLNREPLIAHRLRKLRSLEKKQRAARLKERLTNLARLQQQGAELTEEQESLLNEHNTFLDLLLRELD